MLESIHILLPELGLCLLILLLLIFQVGGRLNEAQSVMRIIHFALPLLGIAMVLYAEPGGTLFGNMYVTSRLILVEKLLLLAATWLISMQGGPWLRGSRHATEYYLLLLSSLLGMFFMLSSGNLMMFYLALELSSIPLAALCGYDLLKRISAEGAMKMIFSSAFSSGLMLFGISLLYGTTGTLSFVEMAGLLDGSQLQVTGFLLFFTGFAFKLSVVPFHFWTPDVYEGAPVPVAAFLSVVSKGAMAFVLVSVLYAVFKPLAEVWYAILCIGAVLSMTIGNLMAIRQDNLKRFLAFSSISQVGYILIAISGSSAEGMAAVVYFILIYIFSNLGAFSVITLVDAGASKGRISDLRGFYRTNPSLAWALALCLFSLAGIPPTAGFFGKFFLITAGAAKWNAVVLIIAALNMIVSLYYYLRVIRAMFMDSSDEPVQRLKPSPAVKFALLLCISGVLLLGFSGSVFSWLHSLSFGV